MQVHLQKPFRSFLQGFFAKKMVHPAGFDEERSDEVREHRRPQGEKRRATRRKVSNPIFLQMQKNNGKKKKQQRANEICQSPELLFAGIA